MQLKNGFYQNEIDNLYDNLGDAYLEKGNQEESLKHYKAACEIRKDAQQIEKIVKSLNKIREYYSKVENDEKVQQITEKVMRMLKDIEELSTPDINAESVETNFLGDTLLKENYCLAFFNSCGLFGNVVRTDIKNLVIDNCTIIGNDYVGALLGTSHLSKIDNVTISNCKIYANRSVGAVAGEAQQNVFSNIKCYNNSITANECIGSIIKTVA